MTAYQDPGKIELIDGRFQIEFNPEAFWKNIRGVLISAKNNEWGGAIDSALKAIDEGFSKTNSLEHKAYMLVMTALHRACVSVLTDRPEQQQLLEKVKDAGIKSTGFYGKMSSNIGKGQFSISAAFFAAPHQHPMLQAVKEDYSTFLTELFGIGTEQARALASAVPGKFVKWLAAEWERKDYSTLVDHFNNNPFLEALRREAKREARHADLLQRFAKPAFNDPLISLAEMYISPKFWIHQSCLPEKEREKFDKIPDKRESFPFYSMKNDMDLHAYTLKWMEEKSVLNTKGESNRLLVLLGQPGQGKSSYCLRLAAQLISEQPGVVDNIYLLRLSDVINVIQLMEDPLSIVCKILKLENLPGEHHYPETALQNSLLLLDGLDELYMSQGLSLPQINDFIRKLNIQIKQSEYLKCRIIVTSRTNYLKTEDLDTDNLTILHLAELSTNQQKEWLNKYLIRNTNCTLTISDLDRINDLSNSAYKNIRELINQPILLQLVAVSGIKVAEKTNTALIYKELFDLMIQRKWTEDGQLDKFKKLKEPDLRRFLQVLALSIFQSDNEYVKRTDFEKEGDLKDELKKLKDKLGQEEITVKEFVKDLLVSFYFQETERDGREKRQTEDHDQYAYEFLHKSLQEYLVAEYIWKKCKHGFLEKDIEDDFRIIKWNQALDLITPLFEKKVISQEIADYLREIIQNDPDNSEKEEIKTRMKLLLPGLLNHQFLLHHQSTEIITTLDRISGNFYGYWTVISSFIEFHPQPDGYYESQYKIMRESENILDNTLKQPFSKVLKLFSITCYRRLILSFQDLSHCDLNGIELPGSDFRQANLAGIRFNGANLSGSAFFGANLSGSQLFGAYLVGAYFSNATMINSNLFGAYLRHSYLDGTYLNGSNLNGADIGFANLNGTYLINSDLSGADLDGAFLDRADFLNANLSGTNLSDIDLSNTINLSETQIKQAKFEKRWDLSVQ